MKRYGMFILAIFLSLFLTRVDALSFEKTTEIDWEFSTNSEESSSEVITVEDGYIYTEYYWTSDTSGIKVYKRTKKGTIVWSTFIQYNVDDDYDHDHDIVLLNNNIYFTALGYGVTKLDAYTGKVLNENTEVSGYDIKEINGNLAVANANYITVLNNDLKELYTIASSEVNVSYSNIYFDLFYVEDNKIYVLTYIDDNTTNYIVTLNDKLEVEKNVEVTYDDNQGFLSDNGWFNYYYSFIKYGDKFYQVGRDLYEINSNGKATLILDSNNVDNSNYSHGAMDAQVIDNNLVILKNYYNDKLDKSYIGYVIYDNQFNIVSSLDFTTPSYSWTRNLSFTEKGFVVKWTDETDEYISYITEFEPTVPSCTIINGTGKNIGDEIQCGTENFYVLSNDGVHIKMLSKYNLYAGSTYYRIEFEKAFDNYQEAYEYFQEKYPDYDGTQSLIANSESKYVGAFGYKDIETDIIRQNEKAIGAHGNLKVEPLFPEVGVYNYVTSDDLGLYKNYLSPALSDSTVYSEGYMDFEINLKTSTDAVLYTYLNDYKEYLYSTGVQLDNMTILSVTDLNNIIYQITDEHLPLQKWWNSEWGYVDAENYRDFYVVGSIKDLMPSGYEWLWSTTYWTKTLASDSKDGNFKMYFVDTMGDLCNSTFCSVSVGAGIRPVVTMSADELKYIIKTKTDGNGTVESTHIEAGEGQAVQFKVTPKEGYELKEIKVTDENGNVLVFTDYTFVMPSANVLIEATFTKIENPNTFAFSILTVVIVGILAFIILKNGSLKLRWINEQ